MSLADKDYIRVFLHDYAASLRVGCCESEKKAPQTVIINVECEAVKAERFDDVTEGGLERVIDYRHVHHFIGEELPKLGHIPLLETVGEKIIEFCFTDPLVMKVRVRMEKPGNLTAVAGSGVEMFRVRRE